MKTRWVCIGSRSFGHEAGRHSAWICLPSRARISARSRQATCTSLYVAFGTGEGSQYRIMIPACLIQAQSDLEAKFAVFCYLQLRNSLKGSRARASPGVSATELTNSCGLLIYEARFGFGQELNAHHIGQSTKVMEHAAPWR